MGTEVAPFTAADLTSREGAAYVLDTVLAERLGFERPRAIRQIIERNRDELEAYGSLLIGETDLAPRGVALNFEADLPRRRGRPAGAVASTAFYLNRQQAILVTVLSRTETAKAVRRQVIEVFDAWQSGALAPAPAETVQLVGLLTRQTEAMERQTSILEGLTARVQALEGGSDHREPSRAARGARGSGSEADAEDIAIVRRFVQERLVADRTRHLQARLASNAFRAWCTDNDLVPLSEIRFARILRTEKLWRRDDRGATHRYLFCRLRDDAADPACPEPMGQAQAPVVVVQAPAPAIASTVAVLDIVYGFDAIGRLMGMTAAQARHRLAAMDAPLFKVGRKVATRRASLSAWLSTLEHGKAH